MLAVSTDESYKRTETNLPPSKTRNTTAYAQAAPLCLEPDEDVRVPHARNRTDVFSDPRGHALRLGPHPARRPHANARSTAPRDNFGRDALGGWSA